MLYSSETAVKQVPEEMWKKGSILYILWDLGEVIFRKNVQSGSWLLLKQWQGSVKEKSVKISRKI